jgi:colanic acid/amylovoran biosynthesis protein
MATRFLLAGHKSFRNRGCEAIVRTTVPLLREGFPGCEIALASKEVIEDSAHATGAGLRVFDSNVRRGGPRWYAMRGMRKLGMTPPPQMSLNAELARQIEAADVVMQIGGDNFTSDYGLNPDSPLLAVNRLALAKGRPLVFWSVSVGPFATLALEALVMAQMRAAALVTVRESISRNYLREQGVIDNVVPVADPAMLLEPAPVETAGFWPAAEHVLAVNVSPLASSYRADGDTDFGLKIAEVAIEEALSRDGWGVLLLPHVTGGPTNDDHRYMSGVLQRHEGDPRVTLAPGTLDCAQAKFLIARSDALVAARTHATIAGFSSCVPTISLAYSRKAHGINLDLFDHRDWLLDVMGMKDASELLPPLRLLLERREEIRAHLAARMEQMRPLARAGLTALQGVVTPFGGEAL